MKNNMSKNKRKEGQKFFASMLVYKYINILCILQVFLYIIFMEFVNPNNSIQDTDEGGQTSGYGNHANGKYFSEGYNLIYDKFKDTDEVVLMLSEDHFFTTGKVLQELLNNEYDVAFANGYAPGEANGSILAIRPNKVSDMFPLPETRDTVEQLLLHHIIKKLNGRGYQIQNRKWLDYCGDGIYTNSSKEMIDELKKAQII